MTVRREGGQVVVTGAGYVPDQRRARASESGRVLASPSGAVLAWQKL